MSDDCAAETADTRAAARNPTTRRIAHLQEKAVSECYATTRADSRNEPWTRSGSQDQSGCLRSCSPSSPGNSSGGGVGHGSGSWEYQPWWTGHSSFGAVPEMKTSVIRRGQPEVKRYPVSGSISAVTMSEGTGKPSAKSSGGRDREKSAKIGTAA